MDLRVVVIGGGRVGSETAQTLDDRGHEVTIIERDSSRCAELADAYFATVLEGDGSRPDVLKQSNPARADVVAGLTASAGTNLGACVLAQRLNPNLRTVMRVETPEGADGYGGAVTETVYPERSGARTAVNSIIGGTVRSIESFPGALELAEVQVDVDAPVANRQLAEIALPEGSLVVSNAEGDRIARAETTLEPGRRYLVAAQAEVADEIRQLFQG
jgi:trk system potassium uptake protein TrkA